MTHFADLSDYPVERQSKRPLRAVGWVDGRIDSSAGTVSTEFVQALGRLVVDGAIRRTRGLYRCRLCSRSARVGGRTPPTREIIEGEVATLGGAEIWVSGSEGDFASPDMVYHYVVAHSYRPLAAFVDAVLQGSALPDDSVEEFPSDG